MTRAGRVFQLKLSWEIGASLGSSLPYVKQTPNFSGVYRVRDLPRFLVLVLILVILIVFVVALLLFIKAVVVVSVLIDVVEAEGVHGYEEAVSAAGFIFSRLGGG